MILIKHELIEPVHLFYEKAVENGFERRLGQIEMSEEVCEAVEKKIPLAVEAGVGIGKSIDYLVPVILQYFRDRQQIILATSTIALQEQLEADVHTVLNMIGVKTNVVLAVGMKNYVCMKRLNRFKRHNRHDIKNLALMTKIADGKIQLRTHIGMEISDEIWDKICIKHIGESCKNCTYIHNCQYSEMRSRLQYEGCIVICNQNMLVSHLVNRSKGVQGIFSPSANIIVVDEAHNIESKFRNAYTKRIKKQQIKSEIAKAEKSPKGKKCDTKKLHNDLNSIFASLKHDINLQRKMSEGTTKTYYFNCGEFLKEKLFSVRKAMAELERKSGVKLESLAFLREFSLQKKNSLVWLEYDDELTFCICKKDIRKEISSLLFRSGVNTILTSETLSSSDCGTPTERCRYFLDTLDFPTIYDMVSEPKKSPFDYEHSTILYISPNMPYPKYGIKEKEKYAEASIFEIIEFLNITQVKALILFTAKSDMNYVFRKLSNMGLLYKIMIQSEHSSQQRKLDKFKRTSIL